MRQPQEVFASFLLPIIFFLTLIPSNAQHMNEPDSPCAKITITTDLASCLSKARASSDAELNSLYRDIRKRLDRDELTALTQTQRLWIQYRDANCSAERALYGTGTGAAPAYLSCLEAMTRARTKELQVTYKVRLK
jgi:uncharacterized protein YecT (DUF1311 family)